MKLDWQNPFSGVACSSGSLLALFPGGLTANLRITFGVPDEPDFGSMGWPPFAGSRKQGRNPSSGETRRLASIRLQDNCWFQTMLLVEICPVRVATGLIESYLPACRRPRYRHFSFKPCGTTTHLLKSIEKFGIYSYYPRPFASSSLRILRAAQWRCAAFIMLILMGSFPFCRRRTNSTPPTG